MAERDGAGWLQAVYGATDRAALGQTYDAWAASYDVHVAGFGYRLPAIVAGLTGRFLAPEAGAVLDAGCGTGALGEVLAALGYSDLVGIDLSPGMLAKAAETGAYGALARMVLGEPLDFADDRFAGVVCGGVLTVGHAPPAAFDELLRVARPGGRLIFSISDPVLESAGFGAKMQALTDQGRWRDVAASERFVALPGAPEAVAVPVRVYVRDVL